MNFGKIESYATSSFLLFIIAVSLIFSGILLDQKELSTAAIVFALIGAVTTHLWLKEYEKDSRNRR